MQVYDRLILARRINIQDEMQWKIFQFPASPLKCREMPGKMHQFSDLNQVLKAGALVRLICMESGK